MRVLLLKNGFSAFLRHICKWTTHSLVPQLPSQSTQHWIRIQDRTKLELRRRRESISCKKSCCLCFLLGVAFPCDVAVPARILLCESNIWDRCRLHASPYYDAQLILMKLGSSTQYRHHVAPSPARASIHLNAIFFCQLRVANEGALAIDPTLLLLTVILRLFLMDLKHKLGPRSTTER